MAPAPWPDTSPPRTLTRVKWWSKSTVLWRNSYAIGSTSRAPPLLRIRVGEARAVTETLTESTRDIVIRDVFAGSTTPTPLTTAQFTTHVRRVLAPGGIYIVNCGDTPDLQGARSEAATIGAQFEHMAIIADPAMLKGRRYGNMIIAGSDVPIGGQPALARELLGGGVPAHVWQDAEVRKFAANAPVRQD